MHPFFTVPTDLVSTCLQNPLPFIIWFLISLPVPQPGLFINFGNPEGTERKTTND